MATATWTHMITETRKLREREQRIYNASWALAERQAKALHPETGGNSLLCHNWGNEAAKRAWDRHQARSNRIHDFCRAEYHKLWKTAVTAENQAA